MERKKSQRQMSERNEAPVVLTHFYHFADDMTAYGSIIFKGNMKEQILRMKSTELMKACRHSLFTKNSYFFILLCIQDSWLSKKADEIQGLADKNVMKNF